MTDRSKAEFDTANKILVEKLTRLWSTVDVQMQFMVNAPMKLTEYTEGRFHKKSFIGEEVLVPLEAYMGKKGNMIFKFREPHLAGGHIEMTASEACQNLVEFKQYYTDVLNNIDDILRDEHREMAAAKEEEAHKEARRHADPLFGSW